MTRRLPVYIIADCSGSMEGDQIEAVNQSIRTLHSCLMGDPSAIETVWLSMITFGDSARQTVPLTEVCDFEIPELHCSGQKSLGAAFELLGECVDREVYKTTSELKGDWNPIVFLMTNGGEPTDSWEEPAQKMHARWIRNIIGITSGAVTDTSAIYRITETVINMNDVSWGTLYSFVESTIGSASCAIDEGTMGEPPSHPTNFLIP